MNEQGNDPGRPRPEVVSETVVVAGDSRQLARTSWGLVLAVGIVAVVFGIIVLANIWGSVRLVAIFAGLFLLFAGILQFFAGGGSRNGRIAAGVIAVIAGLMLIVWPDASVKTIAVIVGLSFLIWGIAVAAAAIAARGEGYGVVVGFGFILAVVGIVFIAWPGPTVTLLMVLVGASAVLFGISAIVQGLALRRS
jgi:uncharacterized membrane protein HdeD (DUF308 family)